MKKFIFTFIGVIIFLAFYWLFLTIGVEWYISGKPSIGEIIDYSQCNFTKLNEVINTYNGTNFSYISSQTGCSLDLLKEILIIQNGSEGGLGGITQQVSLGHTVTVSQLLPRWYGDVTVKGYNGIPVGKIDFLGTTLFVKVRNFNLFYIHFLVFLCCLFILFFVFIYDVILKGGGEDEKKVENILDSGD